MCSIWRSARRCTRPRPSCSGSTRKTNRSANSWRRSSAAGSTKRSMRRSPEWRQIDNDPRWRQWLLFSDPLNGRPRQSLLNDAIAKGDATRVLSFFRGYLAEAGQSPQPQHAPSAPTSKRTYTRADITRYSDAYRRGRIPEAEYQKISADIHAAIGEGRIANPPIPKGKAPHG